MKTKLKVCDGECGAEKVIWKNHQGKKYCQSCWLRLSVTGEKFKPTSRQKPIAHRSPYRATQEREYLRLRKGFLLSSPLCTAHIPGHCTTHSTDVHHKKGRTGSLLTDKEHFLSVCRACHDWIEMHPKEAIELGFSISREL